MASENREKAKLTRRDFARRATIAAATAAALPGRILAVAHPTPAAGEAAKGKAAVENQSEIESEIQSIFRRYGNRLSDAQKAEIRRLVREGQKPLDAMRAFALDNADQPGNVLRLYPDPPGEDGAAAESRR